jgi:hypothetical protein
VFVACKLMNEMAEKSTPFLAEEKSGWHASRVGLPALSPSPVHVGKLRARRVKKRPPWCARMDYARQSSLLACGRRCGGCLGSGKQSLVSGKEEGRD